MPNDPVLHLLGLAKKAGRLEIGEEPVGAACRSRQARLVLLAADAASNTRRRAAHFGQAGNVLWLELPFEKSELGLILGRTSCAMLALTDAGFSAAIAEKLAARDPEQYGPAAAQLREKADRVLQRQKEQRRHEKNLQRGKKAPWAPPPKEREVILHCAAGDGKAYSLRQASQLLRATSEQTSKKRKQLNGKKSGPGGKRLTGKLRKP